jgi:hypothetical protein
LCPGSYEVPSLSLRGVYEGSSMPAWKSMGRCESLKTCSRNWNPCAATRAPRFWTYQPCATWQARRRSRPGAVGGRGKDRHAAVVDSGGRDRGGGARGFWYPRRGDSGRLELAEGRRAFGVLAPRQPAGRSGRGATDTEGGGMTDRQRRDQEHERRSREEYERQQEQQEERERRSDELREAWRRRHPDEEERERRRREKNGGDNGGRA